MFAEIHDYYEKVKEEIEARSHAGLQALAADVKSYFDQARAEALKAVAGAAPDVQAAVQNALALAEQALLAAIAAHVV